MRIALLGADSHSLALVAAAIADGHELAWQGDFSPAFRSAYPWLTEIDQAAEWEDLLIAETADAIIVGRGTADDDLRTRQVLELTRLGRPMLTSFPLFTSVLTYFEVDMARSEGGGVLQHYNPLVEAPQLADHALWLREGHPRYGRIEQIAAVRAFVDRNQEQVLRRFAADVDLLGQVAGKLTRLGAHAPAGGAADYSALSIQLLGVADLPVRWSVEPPTEAEGLTLHFICERGRETIWFDDQGLVNQSPLTIAAAVWKRFATAVQQESGESTWPAALHAMELADSIEISLRRGRMIDVHDQQLTEELAFKGAMSAIGCGLLMLIIPGLLTIGWLAGAVGVPLAEYWPHLLLAILAIFLGLQFLPKLLSKPSAHDAER